MEELKEIITCSLDQRGVLSRLKAELRANVFLAVDEQDKRHGHGGIAIRGDATRRDTLANSDEGALLLDLVHEFLDWADLRFTSKVFEAEARREGASPQRRRLAAQLGLDEAGTADQPLLMAVLAGSRSTQPMGKRPAQPGPREEGLGPADRGDPNRPQQAEAAHAPKLPLAGLGASVAGARLSAGSGGGAADLGPLLSGADNRRESGDGSGSLIAAARGGEPGAAGSGAGSDGGAEETSDGEATEEAADEGAARQLGSRHEDWQPRGRGAGPAHSQDDSASDGAGSESGGFGGASSTDTLALPGLGAAAPAAAAGPPRAAAGSSAGAWGTGAAPPLSPAESCGAAESSGGAGSGSPGDHSRGSWEPSESGSPSQRHLPFHLVPLQPARKLAPLAAAPRGAPAAHEAAPWGAEAVSPAAHDSSTGAAHSAGPAPATRQQARVGASGDEEDSGPARGAGGAYASSGYAYAPERVIDAGGSDEDYDEDLPEELPSEVQDEESSQLFTVLRPSDHAAAAARPAAAAAAAAFGGPPSPSSSGEDSGGSEYLAEALRVGGSGARPAAAGGGAVLVARPESSEDEF